MRVSKIRIEMNNAGFKQLATSAKIGKAITGITERIRDNAGEGFESDVGIKRRHGAERQTGMVWAATREARKAEAENKVLTRAVGG